MKLIKPKFWDYKKPSFLSHLLLPLTIPIIINNFFLSLKKNNIIHHRIKKNLYWEYILGWDWKNTTCY